MKENANSDFMMRGMMETLIGDTMLSENAVY